MASSTVAVPSGTASVSPKGFSQGSDNVDGGDIFTNRGIASISGYNGKFFFLILRNPYFLMQVNRNIFFESIPLIKMYLQFLTFIVQ